MNTREPTKRPKCACVRSNPVKNPVTTPRACRRWEIGSSTSSRADTFPAHPLAVLQAHALSSIDVHAHRGVARAPRSARARRARSPNLSSKGSMRLMSRSRKGRRRHHFPAAKTKNKRVPRNWLLGREPFQPNKKRAARPIKNTHIPTRRLKARPQKTKSPSGGFPVKRLRGSVPVEAVNPAPSP